MTVRRYRDDSNSFKEPSEENHSQHNFRIVPKTNCGRQNGKEGRDGFYLRCGQSRQNLFQKRM